MAAAAHGHPGLGQPIDGMLAASKVRRVEALEHLMSAAVELSLAAKAMADAVERAAEFGRAWLEVSEGACSERVQSEDGSPASEAAGPESDRPGADGPAVRAWVDGLQLVQRSAVPLFEGLARSFGGVVPSGSANGSAREEASGDRGL